MHQTVLKKYFPELKLYRSVDDDNGVPQRQKEVDLTIKLSSI